ncbi:hypothetical protein NPIL_225131 [Nephila pilipes]|uniref:Uncharacterized protein n=1 Tax=Nephila pilipes TaxID=299642 RepID=A0A8X6IFN1_NEPPI|nr:hypothetical protein NPIL_225131 [Nephila pilipes]
MFNKTEPPTEFDSSMQETLTESVIHHQVCEIYGDNATMSNQVRYADFVPSDLFLFGYLKEFLGGQRVSNDKVKTAFKDWTSLQVLDVLSVVALDLIE